MINAREVRWREFYDLGLRASDKIMMGRSIERSETIILEIARECFSCGIGDEYLSNFERELYKEAFCEL